MGTLSVTLKNIEVVRISYVDENKGYVGIQSHELLEGGRTNIPRFQTNLQDDKIYYEIKFVIL